MPKKKAETGVGPQTLQQAVLYFSNPDNCLDYVVARRWPKGVTCPSCGSKNVSFLANQRRWKCRTRHPLRQFSAKVGSIFEDSPLGFDKWLVAMWMLINCKNGVSSYEIHRALKVTQKTGWFMLQRIRLAMQRGSFDKIGGEIEADETYVGGKARFMHKNKKAKKIKGRGTAGKTAVFGLLQRHGKGGISRITASVIDNPTRETLQGGIREQIEAGATIYTDEHSGYTGLDADYAHNVINHAEAYVRGNVHTNGLENFWSLLKRGIRGTYVSVEPFHLFRYIDEQAFRFNERKNEEGDAGRFSEVVSAVAGKRLAYKKLIGEKPEPTAAAPLPS